MSNLLLRLIEQGKISSLDELKSAYRTATLRTHPDAAGSSRYLETFLRLNDDYLEAKDRLTEQARPVLPPGGAAPTSSRLAFFRCWSVIETLEIPYAYNPRESGPQIDAAKMKAKGCIGLWRADWSELYAKADAELVGIKTSKPSGPYLRNALGLNLRPLIHNLIGFHLSGRELYLKQVRQNLSGIMHRLAQAGHQNLKEFLTLLIDDMKNGPAVLD